MRTSGSGAGSGAVTGKMSLRDDPDERNRRGREAEALAAAHLAGLGWELLDRNHRCARGEVDLVFRAGEEIHFVEVRSRTGDARGGPEETVGARKARRVIAAATDWAEAHDALSRPLRFDVVGVTFGEAEPQLVVFRDAFDGDGRPGHW
jgi:putative endonuclease